jgi:type IV secretory pathway TraG/TraD family ATPase VirD4
MRFIKSVIIAVGVCLLGMGSAVWIASLFASDVDPDSLFVRYGWVAPLALFAWAVRASGILSLTRHLKKMAAAQKPSNTVGHASFGTTETLTDNEGGIRLAFDKAGKLLRYAKLEGHGLLVGATGSGKGTTFIITAILDLAGRASIIYADFKGNTTAVCGDYLASKGKLIVCNLYENQKGLFPMTLPRSTPHNPLAGLRSDEYGFTAECERIAETFADGNVTSHTENSAHFKDRATDLIAGVIMHVCDVYPEDKRNLTTVRNILTSSNGESFWWFVIDARANGSIFTKQKLSAYAEVDDEGHLIARASKEVADVLATAARYTRWFGNEDIGPSLEEDGFRFEPLKDEATAVALICPLQYLHGGGGKWLKLMVTSAIHALWRNGRGKLPVYFFLDESDQYADPIIHAAINTARNFGIVLIVIVQQISDIDARYGKQAGAFINGTAWKIFFASDDQRTRDVVEKLAGTKAVMVPSVSLGDDPGGSTKLSFGEKGIPLKAAYEVGEIADDECLIKINGLGIIEAKRKPYWQCEDLQGKWSPDPYEN